MAICLERVTSRLYSCPVLLCIYSLLYSIPISHLVFGAGCGDRLCKLLISFFLCIIYLVFRFVVQHLGQPGGHLLGKTWDRLFKTNDVVS